PLVAEKQFGSVLPIIKYTDLEQAIEWANGLEVGLGSSVWGTDLDACREVAARLQAGSTWINKHGAVDPRIPFGGVKKSGFGLEFGLEGLNEVSVPHVISWEKGSPRLALYALTAPAEGPHRRFRPPVPAPPTGCSAATRARV